MVKIYQGEPDPSTREKYRAEEAAGVTVWYPAGLKIKDGRSVITVRLRRLLWMEWLEIDGAQGLVVY